MAFQDAGFAFQGTGQFAFQVQPQVGTGPVPAGRSGPAKRQRYLILIDDEEFEVSGYEQAVALLERARAAAVVHAEQIARRVEKRVRRKGKAPEIQLPLVRTEDDGIRAVVASYRERIRDIYLQAAQNAELRERLRLKFQAEDEDDAEFLLLH